MALDTLLIGILACPIDKGTLLYFEDDDILYNPRTKTVYDVNDGIQAVSVAISDGMTIDPSCSGLLGEMPGYVWQQDRNGMKEKPIEINDDACDALRYGVIAFAPDPNNPWSAIAGKSASAEA